MKVDYEPDKTEIVNLTSTRCHPIGWTREHKDQNFILNLAKDIPEYKCLPKWLFNYSPLTKHKFEVEILFGIDLFFR